MLGFIKRKTRKNDDKKVIEVGGQVYRRCADGQYQPVSLGGYSDKRVADPFDDMPKRKRPTEVDDYLRLDVDWE